MSRPRIVAWVFLSGLLTLTGSPALGATPPPSIAPAVDPRGGAGASMTGDPFLAAFAVIAIGCAAGALTYLALRAMPRHP